MMSATAAKAPWYKTNGYKMISAINKTDVISEAEAITAEKSLLYVALTRTLKVAYITSYGKKSELIPDEK